MSTEGRDYFTHTHTLPHLQDCGMQGMANLTENMYCTDPPELATLLSEIAGEMGDMFGQLIFNLLQLRLRLSYSLCSTVIEVII